MMNLWKKPETTKEVYAQIAHKLNALRTCEERENDFAATWKEEIEALTNEFMPHGSGIDNGVKFDFDSSKENKLIFTFSYHFMDENGYYDGWEDYKLVVTPSLWNGFDLKIIGKDRSDIKEYFYQVFSSLI